MWLQFSHLELEYYDRFFDPRSTRVRRRTTGSGTPEPQGPPLGVSEAPSGAMRDYSCAVKKPATSAASLLTYW